MKSTAVLTVITTTSKPLQNYFHFQLEEYIDKTLLTGQFDADDTVSVMFLFTVDVKLNMVKITYIAYIGKLSNLILKWPSFTDLWCYLTLTASPLENWRPPGCPRTTWMKTIQQDLKSLNLSPNEAVNVAQNHPPWRLTSTFGAKCS